MAQGFKIGRDFRCRMQEEAASRGSRITGSFVEDSNTLRNFRTNALALDEGGGRIRGQNPQVMFEDVSLRELAAETIVSRNGSPVGMGFVSEYFADNDSSKSQWDRLCRMREAGEVAAVDYSMFAGILGQLLINEVLKGFEHEEFVFTNMAGEYPTQFLTGERLPGVSMPYTGDLTGDGADVTLVRPGKAFPNATMSENYITLPQTEPRGLIVGVDRATIYADRTGMISENAAKIGKTLGTIKEIRGLKLLATGTTVAYKEKFQWDSADIQLDAYQAADGTGPYQLASSYPDRNFPFVNDLPAQALVDDKSFQASDTAFGKIVDPNNGLPLTLGIQNVLCTYARRMDLPRILQAYDVWSISRTTGAAPYMEGARNMVSPNPINTLGKINANVSRLLHKVCTNLTGFAEGGANGKADPDKCWWTGDFKEGIKYMKNWDIKVTQAPDNSEAAFTQDIVLRFRADERGEWAVFNPRAIQRVNKLSQA